MVNESFHEPYRVHFDSVHDNRSSLSRGMTINKGTTPNRGSEPRVKKISLTTHGAPDEPTNEVGCIEIS